MEKKLDRNHLRSDYKKISLPIIHIDTQFALKLFWLLQRRMLHWKWTYQCHALKIILQYKCMRCTVHFDSSSLILLHKRGYDTVQNRNSYCKMIFNAFQNNDGVLFVSHPFIAFVLQHTSLEIRQNILKYSKKPSH